MGKKMDKQFEKLSALKHVLDQIESNLPTDDFDFAAEYDAMMAVQLRDAIFDLRAEAMSWIDDITPVSLRDRICKLIDESSLK